MERNASQFKVRDHIGESDRPIPAAGRHHGVVPRGISPCGGRFHHRTHLPVVFLEQPLGRLAVRLPQVHHDGRLDTALGLLEQARSGRAINTVIFMMMRVERSTSLLHAQELRSTIRFS